MQVLILIFDFSPSPIGHHDHFPQGNFSLNQIKYSLSMRVVNRLGLRAPCDHMAEQWEHVEGINSRAISAQGSNIRQWQGNGSNHKGIEVNFTLEQDLLTAIFES